MVPYIFSRVHVTLQATMLVGWSVRWSIRRSVGRSVRPSVRDAFVKIAENGVMQDGDASYVVYTALLQSI